MRVTPIRYFTGSFCYLIRAGISGEDAKGNLSVVDPGDTNFILGQLKDKHVDRVLITHKHHDHIGHLQEFIKGINNPELEVWGGRLGLKRCEGLYPWCH